MTDDAVARETLPPTIALMPALANTVAGSKAMLGRSSAPLDALRVAVYWSVAPAARAYVKPTGYPVRSYRRALIILLCVVTALNAQSVTTGSQVSSSGTTTNRFTSGGTSTVNRASAKEVNGDGVVLAVVCRVLGKVTSWKVAKPMKVV